jgi:beta-N-acetylhexosaminidase
MTSSHSALPRRALPLLAVLAAAAPAAAQGTSADRALSAAQRGWVEETLASLSLREKVGQMVMPWVGGEYLAVDSEGFDRLRAWVADEGIGGIVVSVGLPHSYAAKANALQRLARVPLLVASDMENGPGMRMSGIWSYPHLLPQGGGTAFPPLMALGAAGSDSLAYALGRVTAREARAVGVHLTFGPVLDVNSNPLNPIINTRAFGEDPALVSRLARAYIRGAREGGLLTTGKHFPGHGDTESDSHLGLPAIRADRVRLDAVELPPYRAAVDAGVDGMMTAHIAVTGVLGPEAPPATLSSYFMTDVLRGEMGFGGVLFTDAMDMGGVISRYGDADAAVMAVQAGADVLLMPRDVHAAIEAVMAAVHAGTLDEPRIDASVRRILEAKARAGLPASRFVPLDSVEQVVGVRAHTELAREIARRSLTLARDPDGLVPLRADAQRILAVTYAEANDPAAGLAFAAALASSGRAVRTARVDPRTTVEEFAALRAAADSADVVVLAAFVAPLERSGTISARGGLPQWAAELAAAGRRVVLVSFGSPYLLSGFPDVSAYLLAWGGMDVSQEAAAQALLGRIGIGGTLPVSLPPFHAAGEGLKRQGIVGNRE